MLHSRIDHIVVTASSLAEGSEFIRQSLGVDLENGGEHLSMGTHNVLLKLGEETYLEVIAVNPNRAGPKRPRWFELDKDRDRKIPKLATWVARTNDINASVLASLVSVGPIEPMSRDQFNWLITVPEDGSLPFNGIAPVIIQWLSETQPVRKLKDSGCSLVRIEGFHNEADTIDHMLKSIGFEGDFSVSPLDEPMQPYLVVYIRTPNGERQIRTPWQKS